MLSNLPKRSHLSIHHKSKLSSISTSPLDEVSENDISVDNFRNNSRINEKDGDSSAPAFQTSEGCASVTFPSMSSSSVNPPTANTGFLKKKLLHLPHLNTDSLTSQNLNVLVSPSLSTYQSKFSVKKKNSRSLSPIRAHHSLSPSPQSSILHRISSTLAFAIPLSPSSPFIRLKSFGKMITRSNLKSAITSSDSPSDILSAPIDSTVNSPLPLQSPVQFPFPQSSSDIAPIHKIEKTSFDLENSSINQKYSSPNSFKEKMSPPISSKNMTFTHPLITHRPFSPPYLEKSPYLPKRSFSPTHHSNFFLDMAEYNADYLLENVYFFY
jgi:hypothetical protein